MEVWESGPSPQRYSVSEQDSAFLVAEVESEIVGFAEVSLNDPELDKLYVHPANQRQGIARTLVEAIEQRVRDHGGGSLYVEVSLNAVPFYEQTGFQRTGTYEKTVAVDTESVEMTMVDMRNALR
ncbi:GNAT family N-acetyltransferase (plasmid) [Halorussus limi]|uniref:GNAT family N-acetyltransferase n=2 Tax=Halorussus limi TaxID=2938695 RepID=A0A8U0I1W0_9EURY|nr:GNAT family N-acetyltransferase [Halorussus limi]